MEGSARQAAVHGLSASAILEVAEGLRWTDPALSVALAEHVARSAGDDAGARNAAERSAVLALGQSDRAAALILRAVPQLRDAEREARATDAAVLRCELALAAVRCEEVEAAEALLEPLAAGQVLPATVRADALVAWAAARATRGDVPGVDAAARQVEDLVGKPSDDVRRIAVQRSRARARRVAGEATDALAVLRNAAIGEGGHDGGRETAMLVADQVELLAELGRADEARAVGEPSLTVTPQATTALAVGRVRCALARLVSLPAGDLDAAARLAREAETDLVARGHEAQAAEAIEVLAEVAARRGESRHALDELRRAYGHATAAREETTRARIALAVALARTEAPAPSPDPASSPDPAPSSDPTPSPPDAESAGQETDPFAQVRASLAALGTSDAGEDSSPWSVDALSAALASTTSGPLEELGSLRDEGPADPLTEAPRVEAEPAPEPAPRRRRSRHREDDDPGEALAAALTAAREGGIDAIAASSTLRADAADDTVQEEARPGERDDAAAEARSRRLERARARWETSDSLLPRRPEPPSGSTDDGSTSGGRRGEVEAPQPSEDGADRRDIGGGERRRRRSHSFDGHSDQESAGRADASGDVGRYRRAEDDVLGHSPLSNGHGAVGGGQVVRRSESPWSASRADDRPRSADNAADTHAAHTHAAVTGNGHHPGGHAGTASRREDRPDDRRPDDRREPDDEPVTVAGRWGEGLTTGTSSTGVDDEYRRELALTLVDLLSEYEDAAPPTPQAPPPATSRIHGRSAATNGEGRTRPPARGGTRNGVPSARRADDSGPRLADLLADAMDAYHSAGPDAAPADDRRARR